MKEEKAELKRLEETVEPSRMDCYIEEMVNLLSEGGVF
jgi:hypothetical protein